MWNIADIHSRISVSANPAGCSPRPSDAGFTPPQGESPCGSLCKCRAKEKLHCISGLKVELPSESVSESLRGGRAMDGSGMGGFKGALYSFFTGTEGSSAYLATLGSRL